MDAPERLVRSELSYDNGALLARLDADCTDERVYTHLSDASTRHEHPKLTFAKSHA